MSSNAYRCQNSWFWNQSTMNTKHGLVNYVHPYRFNDVWSESTFNGYVTLCELYLIEYTSLRMSNIPYYIQECVTHIYTIRLSRVDPTPVTKCIIIMRRAITDEIFQAWTVQYVSSCCPNRNIREISADSSRQTMSYFVRRFKLSHLSVCWLQSANFGDNDDWWSGIPTRVSIKIVICETLRSILMTVRCVRPPFTVCELTKYFEL